MAIRYTMHIWNKGKLMPYRGKGNGWPDMTFRDINSIRKYACTLLPKDSTTRRITIYCDGTDSGTLIRRGGQYIWMPYHSGYDMAIIYVIDPSTGKTIPGSKRVMKNFNTYHMAKTGYGYVEHHGTMRW